jgi:acyl-CoA reductase-like NAD-dependent aldehyde dehydrogenase
LKDGWFVEPTIFTGVDNSMRIAKEEVFGPILSVMTFRTDDEAVALANDTPYGLAAGLWSQSLERAITMPRRLRAGTVWVNATASSATWRRSAASSLRESGGRTARPRSTSTRGKERFHQSEVTDLNPFTCNRGDQCQGRSGGSGSYH